MDRYTVQGAKYRWLLPRITERTALPALASSYNLAIPVAEILISRGFVTRAQIDEFLFTTYDKDVHDPRALKDALKAVERIELALERGEKILVFGDYDVDGITSSALMMNCLLPLGAQANFFLPHRVRDGYGISTTIVDRAADNGYGLIITVDNGITAFEPAARARERGIDLIITDHHRPHDHLPDAYAIVNPNQVDCAYPFKSFAGVGVAFKILSLLYERRGLTLPHKAYELLLLGTVADVVPLRGENRFWVRYGLSYVNNCADSLSLCALKKNGKVTDKPLSSLDIGFSITPQINALGRLEDPRQGVKFLIGSSQDDVDEVARILLQLNEARKAIEKDIIQDIVNRIEAGIINARENIIIATSNHWPPGIIGLVASRIVSEYGRPVILLHETKQGILKGSCRSIPALNMFDALHDTRDLLEQFGGHTVAAGLSLKKEHLPAFKARLELYIGARLTPDDFVQKITVDAHLPLPDLTSKFVSDLEHLEPFGNENPVPVFCVKNVVLVQKPTLLKELHVKCMVFAEGVIKPLIFFNRPELYTELLAKGFEPFCVIAQVSKNYWNGKTSLELIGVDIAFSTYEDKL
jgi:single-stranded-DNA-specific exonuclease